MRTKKILLVLLLWAIGISMLYINPDSFVNWLIWTICVSCTVPIIFYNKEKDSIRTIFKDKIMGLLFILFLISGVLLLFFLHKDRDSVYFNLSIALMVCLFIGVVIRNAIIMGASDKTDSHD